MKRQFKLAAGFAVVCAFAFTLAGCAGLFKGPSSTAQAGAVQLQSTGAVILSANEQFTTIRIKCGVCKYEDTDTVIPTPKPGGNYTNYWICPKCGHKQTVVVKVV